jgi:hypothetical protein
MTGSLTGIDPLVLSFGTARQLLSTGPSLTKEGDVQQHFHTTSNSVAPSNVSRSAKISATSQVSPNVECECCDSDESLGEAAMTFQQDHGSDVSMIHALRWSIFTAVLGVGCTAQSLVTLTCGQTVTPIPQPTACSDRSRVLAGMHKFF